MPSEWSTGLWFWKNAVKIPDSLLWKCKSDPECQKCWQMSNMKELGFSASTIDVTLWKLLAEWMNKITRQLPEPFQIFSKTLKHTKTVQHLLHIRWDIIHDRYSCFGLVCQCVFFSFFCKYCYNPVKFSYEQGVPQQMVWPTQSQSGVHP